MTEIIIRSATADDRPAIIAFMGELHAHERAMEDMLADPREMAEPHVAALETWVSRHQGEFLVAEYAGSLIGLVIYGMAEDFGHYMQPHLKPAGTVSDLYVEGSFREKGIGARLLAAAEDRLRAMGVKRIEITTLFENIEARGFYEARGYRPFQAQYSKLI